MLVHVLLLSWLRQLPTSGSALTSSVYLIHSGSTSPRSLFWNIVKPPTCIYRSDFTHYADGGTPFGAQGNLPGSAERQRDAAWLIAMPAQSCDRAAHGPYSNMSRGSRRGTVSGGLRSRTPGRHACPRGLPVSHSWAGRVAHA